MISWGTIVYGAALSAAAAALLVLSLGHDRRPAGVAAAAAGAALGPLLWNAILHRVGARFTFDEATNLR